MRDDLWDAPKRTKKKSSTQIVTPFKPKAVKDDDGVGQSTPLSLVPHNQRRTS